MKRDISAAALEDTEIEMVLHPQFVEDWAHRAWLTADRCTKADWRKFVKELAEELIEAKPWVGTGGAFDLSSVLPKSATAVVPSGDGVSLLATSHPVSPKPRKKAKR